VCAAPALVQVGRDAAPGIVKREHGAAVVIEIGVEAGKIAGSIDTTGEAANTLMIVMASAAAVVGIAARAGQMMIRTPWGVG
jgi:hypothetical protein